MSQQPEKVTTQQLMGYMQDSHHVTIDIRPIEAYNGWTLQGEARGGHIQGTKAFPYEWTGYENWEQILQDKGISPDQVVTVYGYDHEKTEQMGSWLMEKGYSQVNIYQALIREWAADESLPMERLERYPLLVGPDWVNELIHGKDPATFENKDSVVCHSHYGYLQDYHDGHIPGAIELDTMDLESPETWNRRSPQELRQALLKRGITRDTTVVVYGRFSYPDNREQYPGQRAGHLGAMRCAAILLYAGVRDIRILNGGLGRWEKAGYPVSRQTYQPVAKENFGAEIPVHPEIFVDMEKAKELLRAPKGELVSMRSWEEFIGGVSGYNYIGKTGRIAGALFGNCGSDAYHMENYRNPDHTMREYHEVAANWAKNGIVPEKHIAFYCGTGWRASEAFWNAYLMGWPNVSIYDGGWFEWSSNPDNPVEQGEPDPHTGAVH